METRLLLTAQWMCVLLYAKFGYFAKGDEAAHWARFFYISNGIVYCTWLAMCYYGKVKKRDDGVVKSAFWFNIFLLFIYGEHYIPIWNDIIEKSGIFIPIATYISGYLIITFIINFNKNK